MTNGRVSMGKIMVAISCIFNDSFPVADRIFHVFAPGTAKQKTPQNASVKGFVEIAKSRARTNSVYCLPNSELTLQERNTLSSANNILCTKLTTFLFCNGLHV